MAARKLLAVMILWNLRNKLWGRTLVAAALSILAKDNLVLCTLHTPRKDSITETFVVSNAFCALANVLDSTTPSLLSNVQFISVNIACILSLHNSKI